MSMNIEVKRMQEQSLDLQAEFREKIEAAIVELRKVNHWKGLAFAYKLYCESQ